MPQNAEALAFLQRVEALPNVPGVSLDSVLQPSLKDEAELRKLFATDKTNERLKDAYVGLVDVFDAPQSIRTTRARVVKDEEDLSAKYIMPLAESARRKEGDACMVPTLDTFKKNWAVFTEGSLSQLVDWSNVVGAGGSVLACLEPLPEEAKVSKRATRKWYHGTKYPTSDVDLFLWGMTPAQAEVKITKIYEAVRDSVPWDVTCIRTKHTVSIHSQYPYRSVQIVLRLYSSPAEILAGFDIDAPCCAYDGSRVYANPRSIVSMMRQCNTVDMNRRSPSYEVRLAKYSSRNFEIYIPSLSRADIDPTIYERSIVRVEGLARLLVFEKLKDTDSREKFLTSRRYLRGRISSSSGNCRRRKRVYKGDLKNEQPIGGLEMNDYDVQSLHIPYGPGWDARRIDKLVYQTDLGMNSTFNPKNKNRRLHRHPAFFGTVKECMEDCCEYCPKPIDEDERELQEEEDNNYIRGRIAFIEQDPGRQSISGSFNPIDVGEWSAQVYIGPTEKFFAAIVAHDHTLVSKAIAESIDVNRRDHVGRMPLHAAVLAKAEDIACDLIDAGARITSRLPEGRTALHCAAQLNLMKVVKKLLEKSRINKELEATKKRTDEDGDVEMKDAEGKDKERPSSEDDWSSDDNGVTAMDEDEDGDMGDDEDGNEDEDEDMNNNDEGGKKSKRAASEPPQTPADSGIMPEDEEGEPDIFDINAPDWDICLTPLAYAILFASPAVVDELIAADADVNFVAPSQKYDAPTLHPLLLTACREDEDEACIIIEKLVNAGAVSSASAADGEVKTLFHQMVDANKAKVVNVLLRFDPKAAAVLNLPSTTDSWNATFYSPIVSSVLLKNYSMVATLLAYGANIVLKEEDMSQALAISRQNQNNKRRRYHNDTTNPLEQALQPLEASLNNHSDLFQLLIALGAEVNTVPKYCRNQYISEDQLRSMLDWVRFAIATMNHKIDKLKERAEEADKEMENLPRGDSKMTEGKHYITQCLEDMKFNSMPEQRIKQLNREKVGWEKERQAFLEIKEFFSDVERVLLSKNAKTYNDIYPNAEKKSTAKAVPPPTHNYDSRSSGNAKFTLLDRPHRRAVPVLPHLNNKYDELFAACFNGDDKTVQKLCLPDPGAEDGSCELLQITVEVMHPTDDWHRTGITPLSAAIAGRHWDTVRLVFSIAVAQYEPAEEKETKFKLENFKLDDDESDNDSDAGSDDSEDTVSGKREINLVDVSKLPAALKCSCSPSKFLNDCSMEFIHSGHRARGSPLGRTILENDLEAFVQIINLYKLTNPPIDVASDILPSILSNDRPDMLDEYIRRTGRGIDVQSGIDKEGEQDIVTAVNDKNKVYLGLSVHGKKRKDLAKKNDPDAANQQDTDSTPLVWQACKPGSPACLEYLSSSRPIDAYRFYAMSNSDELSIRLRRMTDLETVLPPLLGWKIDSVGESPLTAAVLAGELDIIKMLFQKKPRLMSAALKERHKWTGFNLLTIAVHTDNLEPVLDYLLANGQSPTETDQIRGWNIYHIMAAYHRCHLFEHMLKKLPRDVNEALLSQQSKGNLNTPLHIAVSKGQFCIAELIVDYTTSGLLIRNVYGSIPLHLAVGRSHHRMTRKLVEAGPAEALYTEDGVGNTPLEISASRELSNRVKKNFVAVTELAHHSVPKEPPRFELESLEKNVQELRETIKRLLEDGQLKAGEKLAEELAAFARLMETKLARVNAEDEGKEAEKEKEEVEKRERKDEETSDVTETFRILREAVIARPGQRQLVHLVDVREAR